jgi:hypothetical protein
MRSDRLVSPDLGEAKRLACRESGVCAFIPSYLKCMH